MQSKKCSALNVLDKFFILNKGAISLIKVDHKKLTVYEWG